MLIQTSIFGKLFGDDIILSKIYIHLSQAHNFLIIVNISKPNLNRLCLTFTTQVSMFTTGPMDYQSIWVRVGLGTTSLDSLKNCAVRQYFSF